MKLINRLLIANLILIGIQFPGVLLAQTDQDALMMPEKNLCIAGLAGYNSWTNYWEGTSKRNNDNIGRLSAKSAMLMATYGISNNLNVIAGLPFIATKATNGTLSGLNGFQDLNIFIKWRPLRTRFGKHEFALFAATGYSTPSNDYNIDFMPMSIGLGSNVLSGRLIADVKRNKIFATFSAAYLLRGNVEIDREAYYTTRQVNSNEVRMPNAGNFQIRSGYRSKQLIAEAFLDNITSFDGFDIRKNDMPFVSNKMNSTRTGIEAKYYLTKLPELGFTANTWHTIAGRNVGQSTGFMAGALYTIKFKTKNTNQ